MVDEFERVFWKVCLEDFPGHKIALEKLLPSAIRANDRSEIRNFEKACRDFLESTGVPWPRYDRWLSYWKHPDPRIPEFEDGEEITSADFREAGQLLAQRVFHTFYMAERYKRYLENAEDRPYWQYVAVMDGRTRGSHAALNGKIWRWDDPVWREIWPPNDLECRCRVRALTESQFEALGVPLMTGGSSVEIGLLSLE